MHNSFGNFFRITTFGESHGTGLGVIVDGCPAGVEIYAEDIQKALNKRRPGQSHLVTPRNEPDSVEIFSGMYENKTLGSPIAMMVRNTNQKSGDYKTFSGVIRPGHADFTYFHKYGVKNIPGGGRASARETVARVMGGAIAQKILENTGMEVIAGVKSVYNAECDAEILKNMTKDMVEATPTRCPCPKTAEIIENIIIEAKNEGDSVGGVIECRIKNPVIGLGEPVFNRFEAELAKVMMSLPATKGFEIGSGFGASKMKGSTHNDAFYADDDGKIHTKTNNAGGVLAGITNGEDVVFRVAFKPTSTILKTQNSVNYAGSNDVLENIKGRHDACVLPRAVPLVEAMAQLVLVDFLLMQRGNKAF